MTLTADKRWLLRGTVKVGSETESLVLTIEPGTVILGEKNTKGVLSVQPGAQIDARGTKDHPIVFTSDQSEGSRDRGDWGGLVLNGQGTANCQTPPCQFSDELGLYGGANNQGSSGTLNYVRVEFAGAELANGKVSAGITLRAVGASTSIRYVQVHRSRGSNFEVFGGAAQFKNVYLSAAEGYALRWRHGWVGKAQFVAIQQAGDVISPGGVSGANNTGSHDQEPRSVPSIYNMTVVGKATTTEGQSVNKAGMIMEAGSGAILRNVIVTSFGDACFDIDDPATWVAAQNGTLSIDHSILDHDRCPLTAQGDADPSAPEVTDWLQNPTLDLVFGDPQLVNPFSSKTGPVDMRPIESSPALTHAATPPADGFFDTQMAAVVIGAYGLADLWSAAWTTDTHN